MGTSYHYSFGDLKFIDKKNGITAFVNFGGCKSKPKDYFEGHIEQNGQVVCKSVYGNYMGYADFDGERLFDLREL